MGAGVEMEFEPSGRLIYGIFEDGKYSYVFRTAAHAAMDNVALARYLKAKNVKVEILQRRRLAVAAGKAADAEHNLLARNVGAVAA